MVKNPSNICKIVIIIYKNNIIIRCSKTVNKLNCSDTNTGKYLWRDKQRRQAVIYRQHNLRSDSHEDNPTAVGP